MKIINEKPPQHIWDGCHLQFDIDDRYTIYTYGDTLYNPASVVLDDYLIAHEGRHSQQQAAYEGGPDAWWLKYLSDQTFRQSQEVEAYQTQYETYCEQNGDRNKRFKYLHILATHLSSPMYKVGLNASYAMRLIKG